MAINQYVVDFAINETGDVSGREYVGVFQCKSRLSHLDRFKSDQIRRSLLGGVDPNAAGPIAQNMASAFAEISVRIVEAPDWWKQSNSGVDLPDYNVVTEIYTKCMKIEQDAIDAIVKKAEAAKANLDKPIISQV